MPLHAFAAGLGNLSTDVFQSPLDNLIQQQTSTLSKKLQKSEVRSTASDVFTTKNSHCSCAENLADLLRFATIGTR